VLLSSDSPKPFVRFRPPGGVLFRGVVSKFVSIGRSSPALVSAGRLRCIEAAPSTSARSRLVERVDVVRRSMVGHQRTLPPARRIPVRTLALGKRALSAGQAATPGRSALGPVANSRSRNATQMMIRATYAADLGRVTHLAHSKRAPSRRAYHFPRRSCSSGTDRRRCDRPANVAQPVVASTTGRPRVCGSEKVS